MSDMNALKERAALVSIFASAILTIGKLAAGLASGSLALLSEAGHGLLDTGATILTYFAVKESAKPADDVHHYGHGKVESLAALTETAMLMALAGFVMIEAVHRLRGIAAPVEADWWVFAVLGISICVDIVRWRSLTIIAKQTGSEALAADALHFSSDFVASILVLMGLAATHAGFLKGDALAAIGVALFIAIAGYRLGRRTVDTLLDAAPRGLADTVKTLVASLPGVVGVENVRLRSGGNGIIGDVSLFVPRTMSLERVAVLKQSVSAQVSKAFPEAELTITANPKALDDETILERVLLIAARRRVPVHHVTVQAIEGRTSISLDIEVNGTMSLGAAHGIADSLEAAISDELGSGIEVETHIEPLVADELAGRDAQAELAAQIAQALAQETQKDGQVHDVHDVHDVRVRETSEGLVVNYHCRMAPETSVNHMHEQVDTVERAVRASFPQIIRIVGHAEPLK